MIEKAPFNDFERVEEVKRSTKSIGQKIISRMLHDRRNYANGLVMLRFDNVPYQSVGPIGDNCYGTMFTFTVINPVQASFDEKDWLEEETP